MVVDRRSQSLKHARFWELPRFLLPEDLLVVNDTRVFPAPPPWQAKRVLEPYWKFSSCVGALRMFGRHL